MKKTLIVVNMQNDYITGALATDEALNIVPNVKSKIDWYLRNGDEVIFTQDTHFRNYLDTFEGKHLPIAHCIEDSWGWEIPEAIDKKDCQHVLRSNFGFLDWREFCTLQDIEIIGLFTDMNVITDALILRTAFPNSSITVDSKCCSGTTPSNHNAALAVMKSCQIKVY